jgi:hypothetical protein
VTGRTCWLSRVGCHCGSRGDIFATTRSASSRMYRGPSIDEVAGSRSKTARPPC